MSLGKTASQAGHAYVGAFLEASIASPSVAQAYASDRPGTKVALAADLHRLGRAAERARLAGIPHFVVIDSGCPNFFEGKPVVTALGIGPATAFEVRKITGNLPLL